MTFFLTSPEFQPGGAIPARYTADGANTSPPLKWTGAPAGTRCFALICDDPDAPGGTWVHWVLYDVAGTATELREAVSRSRNVMGVGKQGVNGFGGYGWGGPAPPVGKPHRYVFTLYALDRETGLQAGAKKKELLEAMEGHVLGTAELTGTYKRQVTTR